MQARSKALLQYPELSACLHCTLCSNSNDQFRPLWSTNTFFTVVCLAALKSRVGWEASNQCAMVLTELQPNKLLMRNVCAEKGELGAAKQAWF
jgi:hypothetical protein